MTDLEDLIGHNGPPAERSEHAEQNEALIGITSLTGTFAYRQNTGQAWQGRPINVPIGEYVRVTPGMKILAEARPIDFGLSGAGDIVGQRGGRAFQIEMKTLHGRQREVQRNFERAWTKCGGVYVLARDADQAIEAVRKIHT